MMMMLTRDVFVFDEGTMTLIHFVLTINIKDFGFFVVDRIRVSTVKNR